MKGLSFEIVMLKSYGVDGALCVLVSGPFANLSEGFNHVVDLVAHEKAAAWLEKRKMNLCAARALFREDWCSASTC